MAMTVQQSSRTYTQARPQASMTSGTSAASVRAKQPGLLSRIGKAVGEILNGPQVVQKQNAAGTLDRFQMGRTNYQVSVQRNLQSLTHKGTIERTPLQHMDSKMLAWMNTEIIGTSSARPTTPVASRPAARPAARRA